MMALVFFIYGLAFFILGFAIMLYPKKKSGFILADQLYLIAGFGIVHGINEWLDLFILISQSSDTYALAIIRAATLPVSFLFLVHFGSKTIPLVKKNCVVCRFFTPVIFVVWALVFFLGPHNLLMWDIWSRYLLCIPGAILTAMGLMQQLPDFRKTKFRRAIISLKIAAAAFLCYSILAGLIVKKAGFFPASVLNYDLVIDMIGIPVQVFRSICAVTMAYGIVRVLSIFYWETRNRIRESELKFRTIARDAPVIFFVADNDLTVTFIAGKALTALGLESESLVRSKITDAFPDSPKIAENCDRAINGEEFAALLMVNGFFFEMFLGPLRDDKGDQTGIVGVAVDVTLQTKTNMQIKDYRQELEKTRQLATLGTLSESMAQELGEPLAVTRVFLQRLASEEFDNNLSPALSKKLKDSLNEVNLAIEIIDNFYSTAHITPRPVAEPIDIYQVAQRIVSVFTEPARLAGLTLDTLGTDIVPTMKMPKRELEQIFFILIQNAIDAAQGNKNNKLTISCKVEKGQMILRFLDNCAHVTPEDINDIFEPFFKTQDGNKDTGLGLAIAKRIIEAYEGTITVESQPDYGTTFYVTLPVEHVY